MPPILVTGGTGTLGRHVVRRLTAAGHDVRVLSRADHDGTGFVRGDLATGAGITEAVAGVDVIVHCASNLTGDERATRTLVEAAAGTAKHLVYVSIVGVDRLSFGYYKSKVDAERVVIDGGIPWTILRATQFYDLIWSGARVLGRLPVVPVPAGFRVRPIEADDVAERLVELALAAPAGRVSDLGGPEESSFAELIRTYLRVRGKRRPVVPIRLPGLGKVRAGALLPADPPPPRVRSTWADFVAAKAIGR